MKVAHLTSVHPVVDTRILHKQAATLAAAGHEVVLVAVAEGDAVLRGVRLRAVSGGGGRGRRMTAVALRVLRAALAERADVYHFHDPELIPVGLALKLAGRRVIYDVHEDVPAQVLSKHWIHPRLRGPVARATALLEGAAARLFDAVVVANPAHADRYPAARTVAVRNLPDLAEFAGAGPGTTAREPAAIYVGDLTRARGALEMVRAMALLPPACPARLWLGGRFSEPGLEAACRAEPGWARVDFLGWVDRAQLAARLARARLGLVLLHPVPHYQANYPVKLFECMAAGVPVVASDLPLCREVVEGAGCGLLVDPRDPAAIAGALAWLLDHPEEAAAMGARGRSAVEQRYTWASEARTLLALYGRLGPAPPPAARPSATRGSPRINCR
jgi:glycosyltransferase involved in cell wall biosynthesis